MKYILLTLLAILNTISASSFASGEAPISIENEVVTISPDLVSVEYDFKNNSHTPINKTLKFTLAFNSYDPNSKCPDVPRRASNFRLTAQRKVIDPTMSIQARLLLKNGSYKDVTSTLHNIGLTDDEILNYRNYEVICENDAPVLTGKYKENLKFLIENGFAQNEDFHPVWEVSELYSFKQEFKPGEQVHVVYEYTPTVGDSNNNLGAGPLVVRGNSLHSAARDLDKDDVRCVMLGVVPKDISKAMHDQIPYTFRSVLHNVTSDAAIYGVVQNFTLRVKKIKQRNSMMAICFDSNVTNDDEMNVLSHIKNYLPKKDIITDYLYISN
ncbi:MAG: DUF4424 domain-containing protein [Gallionella sp.]|nr:DUF4424 domain-containing protein [Gallionella sp.]